MTVTHEHPLNRAADCRAGRVGRLWINVIEPVAQRLAEWSFRRNSRRQLQAMDEQMLKDIGLSRTEALTEGQKPFWRA